MLENQFDNAELLAGHLRNQLTSLINLKDCLVYRDSEDKKTMEKLILLVEYLITTLEEADNVRELATVLNMIYMDNKFDYVMNQLANVSNVHSTLVDKMLEVEDGEE